MLVFLLRWDGWMTAVRLLFVAFANWPSAATTFCAASANRWFYAGSNHDAPGSRNLRPCPDVVIGDSASARHRLATNQIHPSTITSNTMVLSAQARRNWQVRYRSCMLYVIIHYIIRL
jgi:hypothetical protein